MSGVLYISEINRRRAEPGTSLEDAVIQGAKAQLRPSLMLILVGEGTGRIPRGTHDWEKFLSPEELIALLKDAGLDLEDCHGLAWGPARGFHLSDDKSLDYLVTAKKPG